MNGAGKKLWGYYPTTKTWVPLQVDANGKVIADMSGISLGDLGDTYLPTPGNQYFLYWDDASSKWTCRILVAGDIPNLDAAKITTGILNPARVGPRIQDADGDTYLWVEKTADEDKIHGVVKGVEAFLIDDAGILTLAKQSSARMRSTVGQSVSNTTWTKVDYNTEVWDIQGDEVNLTTDRITVKVAGIYLIVTQATIYSMPDTSELIAAMRVNGADIGSGRIEAPTTVNLMALGLTVYQLAANDYVEGWVYQSSGVSKNLSTYAGQNYLVVHKIA